VVEEVACRLVTHADSDSRILLQVKRRRSHVAVGPMEEQTKAEVRIQKAECRMRMVAGCKGEGQGEC